jgi:hypothetical protein
MKTVGFASALLAAQIGITALLIAQGVPLAGIAIGVFGVALDTFLLISSLRARKALGAVHTVEGL